MATRAQKLRCRLIFQWRRPHIVCVKTDQREDRADQIVLQQLVVVPDLEPHLHRFHQRGAVDVLGDIKERWCCWLRARPLVRKGLNHFPHFRVVGSFPRPLTSRVVVLQQLVLLPNEGEFRTDLLWQNVSPDGFHQHLLITRLALGEIEC